MFGCKSLVLNVFLAALIPATLIFTNASANTYPPTPTAYFYGDANGDTGITGADLVEHNNFILSSPFTYDTLQPDTPTQIWNTCDITGDRGCTGADLVQLNNYLLSNVVDVGADPWVLEVINFNPEAILPNTWTPITISLHSTHPTLGAAGRAGISVIAEIDPSSAGTGQLSGRNCSPLVGEGRDQAAEVDAQCALSVTVTDWAAAPSRGDTESGTYGLAVYPNGDGDLKLNFRIEAKPALDIPETTLSETINFVKVWYVDKDAVGVHTGQSWAEAFLTPQEGVNAASAGEQVWVADGTYGRLTMKDGVEIYGGLVGNESSLSARGDPALHPTILDGNSTTGSVVIGASEARLDGFTVMRGNNQTTGGGGIYVNGKTNLTIAYSSVTNNQACNGGGGLYSQNVTNLIIDHCVFNGNGNGIACGSGGGGSISLVSGSMAIQDSNILNSSVYGLYGASVGGGGIYNSGQLAIADSSVNGTASSDMGGGWDLGEGGGIYNSGQLTITNSNTSGDAGAGGGMANTGTLNMTGGSLTGSADYAGGMADSGVATLTGVLISDCSAFHEAGGVSTNTGNFINCIFTRNRAVTELGGGACIHGGASFINCTFFYNSVGDPYYGVGGGMYVSSSTPPTIKNTIMRCDYRGAFDEFSSGDDEITVASGSSSPTISNSIIGGGTDIFGSGIRYLGRIVSMPDLSTIATYMTWSCAVNDVIEIDDDGVPRTVTSTDYDMMYMYFIAHFTPPRSSGVYQGTIVKVWRQGVTNLTEDLHLFAGSPAVNTGTSSGAPAYDLENNPRPSPVGGAYDIGAYEYQWP